MNKYIKYTGSGIYRFIDTSNNVIYVGSAKNIDKRLKSHFSPKGSNVDKEAYKNTSRVEIIKTESYGKALDYEQYFINKYKPHYNKRDKSHNLDSKVVKNEDEYKHLENKWKVYWKLRPLDTDRIKANKKDDLKAMFIVAVMFILVIIEMLIK